MSRYSLTGYHLATFNIDTDSLVFTVVPLAKQGQIEALYEKIYGFCFGEAEL